ncbi:MAG: hypothetical protein IGR76_04070 [Synechococcales cyanobacterium T60_A2020_003]|nr:hypothetical protein [Synechococcales cyanobacterium T60_A2020_003]
MPASLGHGHLGGAAKSSHQNVLTDMASAMKLLMGTNSSTEESLNVYHGIKIRRFRAHFDGDRWS